MSRNISLVNSPPLPAKNFLGSAIPLPIQIIIIFPVITSGVFFLILGAILYLAATSTKSRKYAFDSDIFLSSGLVSDNTKYIRI